LYNSNLIIISHISRVRLIVLQHCTYLAEKAVNFIHLTFYYLKINSLANIDNYIQIFFLYRISVVSGNLIE
jgi:hypothetical protein